MRYICYIFVTVALMKIPCGDFMTTKRVQYTDIDELLKRLRSTTPTTAVPVDPTPGILKSFCQSVKKRLDLVIDLARYNWKHGIDVKIPDEDYMTMIERAENKGRELHIAPSDASQLMANLIEAGNTIQYSLISNWYANKTENDMLLPVGRKVSVDSIYYEMNLHEDSILSNMAALNEFRLDRSCNTQIAKLVLDIDYDGCTLKRIAMQMTMCNFCKLFTAHEFPFKVHRGPKTRHTFKRPKYRRKSTVSTISPKSSSSNSDSISYESSSSYSFSDTSSSSSSKSSNKSNSSVSSSSS